MAFYIVGFLAAAVTFTILNEMHREHQRSVAMARIADASSQAPRKREPPPQNPRRQGAPVRRQQATAKPPGPTNPTRHAPTARDRPGAQARLAAKRTLVATRRAQNRLAARRAADPVARATAVSRLVSSTNPSVGVRAVLNTLPRPDPPSRAPPSDPPPVAPNPPVVVSTGFQTVSPPSSPVVDPWSGWLSPMAPPSSPLPALPVEFSPPSQSTVAIPPVDVKARVVSGGPGAETIFIITHNGEVYSQGANAFGELGTGAEPTSVATTALAPVPLPEAVESITAIKGAVYAETSNGIIYVWGNGRAGQLGVGPGTDQVLTPTRLGLDMRVAARRIVPVDDALFIATDNGWYAAGSNSDGRLGIGTEESVFWPAHVVGTDGSHVGCRVISRHGVTAMTSPGGDLLVCGRNTEGQLGLGHTDPVHHLSRSRLPPRLGRVDRVSLFQGRTFVSMQGGCLAAGDNTHGALGVGSGDPIVSTLSPVQVPARYVATHATSTLLFCQRSLYRTGLAGGASHPTPHPVDLDGIDMVGLGDCSLALTPSGWQVDVPGLECDDMISHRRFRLG